jgi:hypothetical protein
MIFFRKRLKNKQAQVDLQTENERLQAENKNLKVSENLMFLVFNFGAEPTQFSHLLFS